ncbi:MAG: hypothetical protein JKY70_18160 [Mucilaginibacter sp.]|nr:hypothetical protein [Mucilaginibacter sp.]
MKHFRGDKNLAVLTTRFVMSQNKPIVIVYHHKEDGMWEFVGDEDAQESDYKVVSLEEILSLDPSLSEIADMKPGQYAVRNSDNGQWEIEDL